MLIFVNGLFMNMIMKHFETFFQPKPNQMFQMVFFLVYILFVNVVAIIPANIVVAYLFWKILGKLWDW